MQSNKKGKCPRFFHSNTKDGMYIFGGISIYLMAAKSLSYLENLWALDTSCTQH